MSAFTVDILTPQGIVAQGVSCKSLFIPTVNGEINVLEAHTHVLTQLSTGVLTLVDSSNESHYYSITAGVCKILGSKISVLSTTSETADQIDLNRAKEAEKKAQVKLSGTLTEEEHTKYYRKLERAKARIRIKTAK